MGRVRETLHDVLRQTDAVLLALCVASTLYGMVLIASATSFRGTLKYVAVQGLGLLIGLVLYFFLSSIDVFALAKQWKWLLGFNVGFLLLLLTPFGQSSGGNRAWLGVNSIGKKLGVDFLRYFPITVQPAEVVKVFFIVLLAYQLALLKDRRDLVRFENVIQPTAHTAFMVGLISSYPATRAARWCISSSSSAWFLPRAWRSAGWRWGSAAVRRRFLPCGIWTCCRAICATVSLLSSTTAISPTTRAFSRRAD